MDQFVIVRYLHSTGMPTTAGPYEQNREQAINKALALSKEHPEDWVRVETSAAVIASFFKGMEVGLYLGRSTS
jgi:hypothetical protein